jgi:hypothetical protein
MPKNMKNHVFGTTLEAIEQKLNKNQISQMKLEFESHWICIIVPIGLVSHFEAEPNSTIGLQNETTQIILFKPVESKQLESIADARKLNPKISYFKNEMPNYLVNERSRTYQKFGHY